MFQIRGYAINTEEFMYWTEDNRMQSYNNMANGQAGFYRYDAGGQRELKLTGKISYVNPMNIPYYYVDFQDAVLYAGNLVTVDKNGYKKHYFMESERFLTNIGGGKSGRANIAVDTKIDGIEYPKIPQEMSDSYTDFVIEYFTAHEHPCEEVMNAENKLKNIPPLHKIFDIATRQEINDLPYYLHNDRLGSGSVITNGSGNAEQVLGYIANSETLLDLNNGFETPYQLFGYEVDMESGMLYEGQRYTLARRGKPTQTSTDRFWWKYPHLSPYHFCANNPIMYMDVNGDSVIPAGEEELVMIQNTLPQKDRKYVQFDKNGRIDSKLLNSHKSKSANYNKLREQVNSPMLIDVCLSEVLEYVDNNGNWGKTEMQYNPADISFVDANGETMGGLTTGENGFMGYTLLPGKGTSEQNSPDGSIQIIIHKSLSRKGRAEIYSHEANGHALLFLRTKNRDKSKHNIKGNIETNRELFDLIIESKQETIKNMKK